MRGRELDQARAHHRGAARARSTFGAALGVVLAAATLLPCACDGEQPDERRLIVFISLDTLRRDAVGVYAQDAQSLTPHLDAFARDAVVFRQFGVQVPFTLPSHMSMLTGLYPDVHRVDSAQAVLAPGFMTLAQVLQRQGWATHAIVTHTWMKAGFGFARGFDSYQQLPPGPTFAERVNVRALELLEQGRGRGQPQLLFLHYYDAHSDFHGESGEHLPYYAPPGWRRGPDASARYELPDGRCATGFLEAANQGEIEIDRATREALRRQYEDGVRHLDHELGQLFDALRERGLWENSLLLVTSDHGEEFGEHGRFLHDQPFEECVAAPLLVRFPAGRWAGRSVDALCESIDLMPTVLDAVDLEPPPGVQGRSLLPLLAGEDRQGARILSRDKRADGAHALRSGRYKLVWDFAAERGQLFDLVVDPAEQRDLASREPERVQTLRRRLEALKRANELLGQRLGGDPPATQETLSEEDRRLLRSLGYLSDG